VPIIQTAHAKHVFLDIVGYSHNRSIEVQSYIIHILNTCVLASIESLEIDADHLILIPTGDGICISLLDVSASPDIHIELSLMILKFLKAYNEKQQNEMRKFEVRIGVNENVDNLITDINGKKNIAGAGITIAQRIMNYADGGNILVGQSVYDILSKRERYLGKFRKFSVTVKHNISLNVYQLVQPSIESLNVKIPKAFLSSEKLEPKFTKIVAYLFGHIIKNKEFIVQHLGPTQEDYALFQSLVFLARDSVRRSGATPSNPFKPYLSGVNVTLEDYYNYCMNLQFWVCLDYGEMFIDASIRPSWGYKYFIDFHHLEITQAGVEKLKKEWPDIVEELGID